MDEIQLYSENPLQTLENCANAADMLSHAIAYAGEDGITTGTAMALSNVSSNIKRALERLETLSPDMVRAVLSEGEEIRQMMKVVGEEGTSPADFVSAAHLVLLDRWSIRRLDQFLVFGKIFLQVVESIP